MPVEIAGKEPTEDEFMGVMEAFKTESQKKPAPVKPAAGGFLEKALKGTAQSVGYKRQGPSIRAATQVEVASPGVSPEAMEDEIIAKWSDDKLSKALESTYQNTTAMSKSGALTLSGNAPEIRRKLLVERQRRAGGGNPVLGFLKTIPENLRSAGGDVVDPSSDVSQTLGGAATIVPIPIAGELLGVALKGLGRLGTAIANKIRGVKFASQADVEKYLAKQGLKPEQVSMVMSRVEMPGVPKTTVPKPKGDVKPGIRSAIPKVEVKESKPRTVVSLESTDDVLKEQIAREKSYIRNQQPDLPEVEVNRLAEVYAKRKLGIIKNASEKSKTAKADGNVRPQPIQGEGQVPTKGSSPGNVPKAQGGLQEGQRVANATANAQRASTGLENLKTAKPETTQQWFDEAAKRGIPSRARQIAQNVLEGKQKRLDDVQSAGLATRLDELDQEFKAANPSDTEGLRQIIDEVDAITQATKKAGTEWGREGVARQTWFKSDYSEEGLMRRFTSEGGGVKEATKAKQLGSEIAHGETELAQARAQAGVYSTRGTKIKGDIKQARADAISRIRQNYQSLSSKSQIKGKQTGAINIDPNKLRDIAADVMLVAKTYIQEGSVTLGHLIPKVRQYLKENDINISDEYIQRILAGEYEKSTKELTDQAFVLQSLRQEARRSVGAQRAMLGRKIAEQEKRIASLSGPAPKVKTAIDKSLRDMEIKLMARKVEADNLYAELRKQRLAKEKGFVNKAYHEIADISRSVVASTDLSAPFNQGTFALAGHPMASARAAKDMLKALKSEDSLNRLIAEIRTSKHYNEATASGLEVHGTRLGRGEEFFTSNLVNNIPLISHSERAYTAYLNKLRMDMFSNLVEMQQKSRFLGIVKSKKLSIEELKQTAEYVNTVTGVGTGKVAQAAKTINREIPLLFAPGYLVSRWKTAIGTPLINAAVRKNPRLAVAILKDYAAFSAMVGGTLYAAKQAGFNVDIDPRSDKFGKITTGNVDIDPFGGILGPIRLMNKAVKSPKQIPIAGGFYVAGKVSPVVSTAFSIAKGEHYGDKTDVKSKEGISNLVQNLLPIQIQTQLEMGTPLTKDETTGLTDTQKAALRLLTILGLNINVKSQPGKGR